jgi:hypothetical protein
MGLDFWNNPIIVSAFRVKYRRSAPTLLVTLYVAALVGLGAVMFNYRDRFRATLPWHQMYFVIVLSVQSLLSGLVALSSTQASIVAEVANRTLDFQRIAALSPRAILVGKLFGEPALAYLLLIGSIPIGVSCMLLGSATPTVLALLYLNLLTTTIFFGALGLIHPLEAANGRPTGGANPGWVVGFMVFMFASSASAGPLGTSAVGRAMIGLVTPIVAIRGVAEGKSWEYTFDFYNLHIPYLFITPLTQLLLTALCFGMMTRRLTNPMETPLSKGRGYLILIVWDLLFAGSLFDFLTVPRPELLPFIGASFMMVHLSGALFAVYLSTPTQEAVQSWIWGLHGETKGAADWWLGNRSPNLLAVGTFAALAPITMFCFLLAPYAYFVANPFQAFDADQWAGLAEVLATAMFVFVAIAIWLQVGAMTTTRLTAGVLVSLIVLFETMAFHFIGAYYKNIWALSFAPSAHGWYWLEGANAVIPRSRPYAAPLWALYGTAAVAGGVLLFQFVLGTQRIVRAKLKAMGVRRSAQDLAITDEFIVEPA